MKVDKLTLERVFERTERLEAPLFQRPYVWQLEDNWLPLWDSIRTLSEHRLSDLAPRPHFLGAIVLDQMKTSLGKIHVRQIVDGQQRLTTLQLALASARDLCTKLGEHKYSKAFEKLTRNDVPLSDEADDTFKIWPTNADREDFRSVMSAASPIVVRKLISDLKDKCLIPNAYLFFADAFDGWLGASGTDEFHKRLDVLYTAIRDDLTLVVIDLEAQDDAQEIFETLNALGTPLLPADLVKNYLFRLAEAEKDNTQKLYDKLWATFDMERGYWRKEVRQGRLKRPRLDLFLNHYLTLMLAREILISQLFSEYRQFVENDDQTAAKQMEMFRSYADVYRSFEEFPDDSPEGVFFYRLDQLDTSTVFPLLLQVVRTFRTESLRQELRQILSDIESFLVRRTICELTPKNYNKLFVDLVKESKVGGLSGDSVRAFLLRQEVETSRWPTDEEFKKAWLELQFYKQIPKHKVRMVLEALESELYTGKTEKKSIERNLTIEHLLPKEWEKHWPLKSEGVDAGAVKDMAVCRHEVLHRIGNLTLLTKKLNPSVSNGPWEKKRKEILKYSALNLNRSLPEVWDEAHIQTRSEDLFKVALKIWPRP